MEYRILFTEDAREDLRWLKAFERKLILAGIKTRLTNAPLNETRNRKPLRENPLGPWELRIRKYRVFYHVEGGDTVKIGAIGFKEHNILFIRGKEKSI